MALPSPRRVDETGRKKVLARDSLAGQEGRIASTSDTLAGRSDGVAWRLGRLQSSVLHPVLVDGEIVEHLGDAAGGAGQQVLLLLAHQPPAGAGGHVAGDVLAGPGVEPGVEAPVQPRVDPLVRLEQIRRRSFEKHTNSSVTQKSPLERQTADI